MSIHTRPGSNFTEIFSEWLLSAVRTGLAPAGTFAVQSTVLDTINKTQKSFWINLRLQFEPSSVHTQVHEKHRAITLWHSELAGLAAALSVPEHNPFNHVQRVLSSPFFFFSCFSPCLHIIVIIGKSMRIKCPNAVWMVRFVDCPVFVLYFFPVLHKKAKT